MTRLFNLKEDIKGFYQKYVNYLYPAFRFIFSLLMLCMIQQMFQYNTAVNKPVLFAAVSAVQAVLPLSFVFYSASALIVLNLWKVSLELVAVYGLLFLICWLSFVRVEGRYAFLIILTPVLFYLKLEYLLPVLVGITVGCGGILPVAGGIFIYFFSSYTKEASALIATASGPGAGIGIQRIVSLMIIDKKLLVILVGFCLTIFIAALLYQMFHEGAWLFAIVVSNIALALILLSGRMIFELDYTIWRVFLEIILAAGLCVTEQFFKGIGDVTRMEKVSFEDDEYIYYVKAVPKIKVAQAEPSVKDIIFGENPEEKESEEKDAETLEEIEMDIPESPDVLEGRNEEENAGVQEGTKEEEETGVLEDRSEEENAGGREELDEKGDAVDGEESGEEETAGVWAEKNEEDAVNGEESDEEESPGDWNR